MARDVQNESTLPPITFRIVFVMTFHGYAAEGHSSNDPESDKTDTGLCPSVG